MSIFTEVVIPILTSLGGAGALLAGLSGYLKASTLARQQAQFSTELEYTKGKVQRGMEDIKLNTERLRFAHTKQFEKEFKLYEELWEHLWNLMNHAKNLGNDDDRELSSVITKEDEISKNQEQVLSAMEPVARFTEYFAPFFHERVHHELKDFVAMCSHAWVNDKYRALALLGKPAATSEEIERQLQKICEAIRWRIGLSDIQWQPTETSFYRDEQPLAR